MWRRAVPGDHRDATSFLKQMRKQHGICAHFLSPKMRHCPASPKGSATHTGEGAEGDPTHKSEDLWSAADTIPERKALIQELFTGRESLLRSRRWTFKNSSRMPAPRSLHLGERKRPTPPSCHTIHQDIQIILKIIFKLSSLQKARPSPEYWLTTGTRIFITWDTITSQRYYRKQVSPKSTLREDFVKPLASTNQALTCKKHSVL